MPRSLIADQLIELLTRSNVLPLEIGKADALDALVRARAFESVPITDALIAASARAAGSASITVPSVHGWPPRTTGRSVGKESERRALASRSGRWGQ